jgi:hypothetical protein
MRKSYGLLNDRRCAIKLKLNENLGTRGAEFLRQVGHDVATVSGHGLCSVTDEKLSNVCQSEKRYFVTLRLYLQEIFGNDNLPIEMGPDRFRPHLIGH